MVTFSDRMQAADKDVKAFLYPHMYRHEKVMRIRRQAHEVVRRLFEALFAEPGRLPGEWRDTGLRLAKAGDRPRLARLVCDYIAGMTDRYALAEHRALFGEAPDLR